MASTAHRTAAGHSVPAEAEPATYTFGPRETRGALLGLRAGQLAAVLLGMAAVVAGLSTGPAGAGAGVAVLTLALVYALAPVAGRTGEQWSPVLAGFAVQRAAGQHVFRPDLTRTGGQPQLPGLLAGLVILSAPVDGEHAVGVLKDRRAGTYVAVVAVRGGSFALLEAGEKDRRTAAWGMLLAGLARDGSPACRIQWVERTVPDTGDALARFWAEAGGRGTHATAASYRALIDAAAPVTQTHETYLAIAIDVRRARRAVRQGGGGDAGACAVLLRELASLQDRLAGAGLDAVGWLPPRGLAAVIRTGFEPGAQAVLARRREVGHGPGVEVAMAGPMHAQNHWASYRSDDGWHATYWVSEWPRMGVAADFLAPLLLQTTCRRAVAVVAEPISPRRAARAVSSARTAGAADEAMRARIGQLTTARQRREAEMVEDRERELVAGHAEYRFSGYLSVTAASKGELEEACGQVEQAAHASLLELRRLYGQQDQAFAFTLPLARGLR